MPLLLLWNRIDFSSDENALPPTRSVFMNCSIVYCFTAFFSLGDFNVGVSFVINALSETSGLVDSGTGRRCAKTTVGRRIPARTKRFIVSAYRLERARSTLYVESHPRIPRRSPSSRESSPRG